MPHGGQVRRQNRPLRAKETKGGQRRDVPGRNDSTQTAMARALRRIMQSRRMKGGNAILKLPMTAPIQFSHEKKNEKNPCRRTVKPRHKSTL